MKVAVIGAGGVGGYFGARLAAGGCEVVFVQRAGAHLDAIHARGLQMFSPLGDLHLGDARATDDPSLVGAVDIVLVTVKSGDTAAAAAAARQMLGADTAVVSLQNGVENEALLVEHLGTDHVAGGVAYILSLIEAPGVIRHGGPIARLVFGELDGRRSDRLANFEAACAAAGITAALTDDIVGALWAKFVFLCPHNGMTALTRMPIGAIRDDAECRALLEAATREVIAVAAAKGIELPAPLVAEPLSPFRQLPADMTSSMHYDVTHGKPLELEWLNGTVVRLGRALGVPTPVNGFIYAGLKLHAAGALS